MFSKQDLFETQLLKILNDANTPHFLFQDLMEWASNASKNGYNFIPLCATRKATIKRLEKDYQLQYCRPFQIPITFQEDGLEIEITAFDFQAQLYSLLSNDELTNDLNMLDVNKDDPFTKYIPPDGMIGTFNSGSWYNNAWDFCVRPNTNDWMCPIIFGIDETLVGSHLNRATATPVSFTLSIFSEETRARPSAWRTLGFVYDTKIHGKTLVTNNENTQMRKLNSTDNSRCYHVIMREILRSFVKVQKTGIKNVTIKLGKFQKQVTIKVPCAMILGDMQGGDKHCASSIGYSKDQARLCRQCDVRGDESGNPLIECNKMSMVKIKKLVRNQETEKLNSICQHQVYSAWFDVDFGGCQYGIFSAAMPIESLHALEGGLIKDCLQILYKEDWKPYWCTRIDMVVKKMTTWDKQSSMTAGSHKHIPRVLWADGITSLEKICNSYIVGMALTVVILTLIDEGKEEMKKAFQANGYKDPTRRLNDTRYIFSLFLCYWSWLKKKTFWKQGDIEQQQKAKWAIRKMLQELIKLWPRDQGHGWFKPKVHEQLHIPGDIARNGSPRNSYSGTVEHNHVIFKNASKRMQCKRIELDKQISEQTSESFIIDYCYNKMMAS